MRRATTLAGAVIASVATTVALGAGPASAATSTAYSAAGYATSGSIAPTTSVTGSIGSLLGPILNPVLSGLVNPLLAGVAQLPQNLVSALTTTLVGATGTSSSSPVSAVSQGSSFPSCVASPWNTGGCYSGLNLAVAAPPILGATLSAATGYTSAVTDLAPKPVLGAASATVTALSLLGIPILSGGVLKATSTCPTVGATSATGTATATNLSLLGGAVTVATGSQSGLLSVLVNGSTLAGVKAITVGGLPISVSLNANLLKLTITLSVAQLLSGLGISVASGLLADVTSSSLALTVTVGPGSSTSSTTTASAWGLDVGVDVSGSIAIGVLGLATVNVAIPSGVTSSGGGNALDLKLAYTTCSAAPAGIPTQAVPPGVN